MRIVSYGCEAYKPFKDAVTIEVRPLTLVFGKNNSGKSALLRLLRLILRALAGGGRGTFPLTVDELKFGLRFRDLIHGRQPHGAASFSIAIEEDQSRLDLTATVQSVAGGGEVGEYSVVSRFDVRSPVQRTLTWEPAPGPVTYTDEHHHPSGALRFLGLLPTGQPAPRPPLPDGALTRTEWRWAHDWRERCRAFEEHVCHLGPIRAPIARVYEQAYGTTEGVSPGFDGGATPGLLAEDDRLLERTADWYQRHLDGWRPRIEWTLDTFTCTLTRGGITVNLADAGQGMGEVLPVVVRQLQHQDGVGRPFLDLIEQPELHLHAAAQAPLADLFLDSARTGRGQVIVETHSENLLLRVRRRIAEGVIDPAAVAVYWVEDKPAGDSTVRKITIDRDGELDWWRPGVFSEDYEEMRAMRRAVRQRPTTERHDP